MQFIPRLGWGIKQKSNFSPLRGSEFEFMRILSADMDIFTVHLYDKNQEL
mgnify:CR=1 FL=1